MEEEKEEEENEMVRHSCSRMDFGLKAPRVMFSYNASTWAFKEKD